MSESYATIEVLKEEGNKRLVKRIFERVGNKLPVVDYCIQEKIDLPQIPRGEERWGIEYCNKSKTLVERRFLGL